eukprot:m.194833 g.194833  ORF g.194833 m.194833 type:complete len:354 (+) comp10624_c0_seq4:68-1129(+)
MSLRASAQRQLAMAQKRLRGSSAAPGATRRAVANASSAEDCCSRSPSAGRHRAERLRMQCFTISADLELWLGGRVVVLGLVLCVQLLEGLDVRFQQRFDLLFARVLDLCDGNRLADDHRDGATAWKEVFDQREADAENALELALRLVKKLAVDASNVVRVALVKGKDGNERGARLQRKADKAQTLAQHEDILVGVSVESLSRAAGNEGKRFASGKDALCTVAGGIDHTAPEQNVAVDGDVEAKGCRKRAEVEAGKGRLQTRADLLVGHGNDAAKGQDTMRMNAQNVCLVVGKVGCLDELERKSSDQKVPDGPAACVEVLAAAVLFAEVAVSNRVHRQQSDEDGIANGAVDGVR